MTVSSRFVAAASAGLAVVVLTGCAPAATYEQRIDYLRKVAVRGAETHALLVAQQVTTIDKKRCEDAYAGLAGSDIPDDTSGAGASQPWLQQVQQFFVDSCVSGVPKTLDDANHRPPATGTAPAPAAPGSAVAPTPAP
jgi:hypothetical protein